MGNKPILYEHELFHHIPLNVNDQHHEEHTQAGFNTRLAVTITQATGNMWAAYAFAALALLGFPALSVFLGPQVALYVVWVSQTFIQLCMLPILSVGQGVLGRKQELQADESYRTTLRTYHEMSELANHLHAQDERILKMAAQIEQLVQIQQEKPARVPATKKKVEKKPEEAA